MTLCPEARALAFYLPQFHPIRENDVWWGAGFTEWTNVARARPLFPWHYQPHIPADLGFYDLRLPETRQAQAELARAHGLAGFCYYHYWFNGKRVLERPFEEVLASGQPDFPFCLCWANENWTRRWDGQENEVLLAQRYSPEDDLNHIRSLFPAFRDPRYLRVHGKPLFLVYRAELLPDPARTAEVWREAARRAGIGDLYLARVEGFVSDEPPGRIGFDAAVEFAPDRQRMGWRVNYGRRYAPLTRLGLLSKHYFLHRVFDYDSVVEGMLSKPEPAYKRFLSVMPSWDNSPRKARDAFIVRGATPEKYESWLRESVQRTLRRFDGDERLIFINAWNEWGEGCHLEPDRRFGRAYLEATRKALGDNHAAAPQEAAGRRTVMAQREAEDGR